MEIKDNAFNAERERKESFNDSDPLRKPRSSSFKDSEKFVYRAGAFVREDSDAYSSGQCLSNHIRLQGVHWTPCNLIYFWVFAYIAHFSMTPKL